MLLVGKPEEVTKEGISMFIEWQKFTDWVNKHDDLEESNLLTSSEYSDYLALHRNDPLGRNGTLDLIENRVIDHNRTVLV